MALLADVTRHARYGARLRNPGSVLGLLAAVAAAASYIPARHAGRVEPLLALRQE